MQGNRSKQFTNSPGYFYPFRLHPGGFLPHCLPPQIWTIWTKNGKRSSDVNRVNGTVFHTGGAHHLIKLAIGGMAYHRLDVASQEGLLDLLLRESLEVLVEIMLIKNQFTHNSV